MSRAPLSLLFRRAASFFPGGAVLVTARPSEAPPFTVVPMSVAALSIDPAILGFSLPRPSSVLPGARILISLLRADQRDLAARKPELLATPYDALVALGGVVTQTLPVGDHDLFLATVDEILENAGRPLVAWRRAFHTLALDYPFLASELSLDAFLRDWETGTLPRAQWTHGAHVTVAACYAWDHDAERALSLTRDGILRYNAAVGTANTPSSGYHETLTCFWASTVRRFLDDAKRATRLDAVRAAVETYGEDRDLHRLYWSFDIARDPVARRQWVPPDL